MSNAMRPENELCTADEGGLAVAPARPAAADAPAAVAGGFDVGAAAAAVAAAAAQPLAATLAQELTATPSAIAGAEAVAADGASGDPDDASNGGGADGVSGHAVDPATGWAIEPNSGWLVEPTTGYLLDPNSGYYVEPTTGYYVDPSTGYLLDPTTGYPLDPATGCPFDPATGLAIDASVYADAADAAAPGEAGPGDAGPGDAGVALPCDADLVHEEPVAAAADAQPALEVAAAKNPAAAGLAPVAELPVDLAEPPPDDAATPVWPPAALDLPSPLAAAEPPTAEGLFTDEPAEDAPTMVADAGPRDVLATSGALPFDDAADIGFFEVEAEPDATAAEGPLVGPSLDLWAALAPAADAQGDHAAPPAAPGSDMAVPAPAEDGIETTMWDLGGAAAGAAIGPDAWPGAEDAARLDDAALASGGSFDVATDATCAPAADPLQPAELPAFDLANDAGLVAEAAVAEPFEPLLGGAPAGPAPTSDGASFDAAEPAWAGEIAVPAGESGIDFAAFESPPAAPAEVSDAEVQLEPEILDVDEEDIVEVADDVEALQPADLTSAPELEAMTAPTIELAPAPEPEPVLPEPALPEPALEDAPPPAPAVEPAPQAFEPEAAAPAVFAAALAPQVDPEPAPLDPEPAPVLTAPRPPPAVIVLGPEVEARPPRAQSPFDPFADLPDIAPLTVAPPAPAPAVAEVADAAPLAEPVPEPAAPVADPGAFVSGKHRVVVHTADGQVKRGAMADAALDGSEIVIDAAGSGREAIPSDRIKAIFFMLPTGETPPTPDGRRVRVTFRDGRQVAGFSRDYAPERTGFFMVPADTRTHTARIWVYQSAVRQVSVT